MTVWGCSYFIYKLPVKNFSRYSLAVFSALRESVSAVKHLLLSGLPDLVDASTLSIVPSISDHVFLSVVTCSVIVCETNRERKLTYKVIESNAKKTRSFLT